MNTYAKRCQISLFQDTTLITHKFTNVRSEGRLSQLAGSCPTPYQIMTKDELIEARLGQITEIIAMQPQAMAIISPHECTKSTSIKDNDCDICLVVLVENGSEAELLKDTRWLADIQHIAYEFKRSPGHFRFLFSDGVFCDFTVLEEQNLELDKLAACQVLWQKETTSTPLVSHVEFLQNDRTINKHEESCWLLGEFLTNLLIGLRRYSKGDKLSAFYLIQHNALSQLLELVGKWENGPKRVAANDANGNSAFGSDEESFESSYPQLVPLVEEFALGYDRSPKSAFAMLQYAEQHDTINYFIKDQIINLIKPHSNLH